MLHEVPPYKILIIAEAVSLDTVRIQQQSGRIDCSCGDHIALCNNTEASPSDGCHVNPDYPLSEFVGRDVHGSRVEEGLYALGPIQVVSEINAKSPRLTIVVENYVLEVRVLKRGSPVLCRIETVKIVLSRLQSEDSVSNLVVGK
jgi:hypothetical protein